MFCSVVHLSYKSSTYSKNTPLIKIEEKEKREGEIPHCWFWVGVAKSHPHSTKKSPTLSSLCFAPWEAVVLILVFLVSPACSVLSSLVRGAEPSKPASPMGISVLFIAVFYTGWVELLAGTLCINRLPFRDLLANKLPNSYSSWIAFLLSRAQLSTLTRWSF